MTVLGWNRKRRCAIDVEKNGRRAEVEIVEVGTKLLELPNQRAGVGVERDYRRRMTVGPAAKIAGAYINNAPTGVDRHRRPDRSAQASVGRGGKVPEYSAVVGVNAD